MDFQRQITDSNVFVIIPAYNETEIIRNTVMPLLGKYQVVVVDDGSLDFISKYLFDLPVHYLRHIENLGQGAALQTGMEYALEHGAEYIIHFDADGQHNHKEIPSFLSPIQQGIAEVCIGSRFLDKHNTEAIPIFRRFILRLAIAFNNLVTGVKLTDAHNGFRAFSRKAAEQISLQQNRMSHATEIIFQFKQKGLSVTEIPTHITYTNYSQAKGQSSLNAINIVLELFLNKIL